MRGVRSTVGGSTLLSARSRAGMGRVRKDALPRSRSGAWGRRRSERRMVDTTDAAPTGERRAERLELRVPTSPTQLPAVRAMAGDLAMRMDFDLDAVEDLRLAVDEACATLSAIVSDDRRLTVVKIGRAHV